MWSQRVQYAIRALVALAAQGNTRIPSREIAERYGIPQKYLETILGDLRQTDFVRSTKGKSGGYQLAREPSTIRLSEVMTALEPEWVPRGEHAQPWPEDPILMEMQACLFRELERATIAEALMKWQQQQQTPNYVI